MSIGGSSVTTLPWQRLIEVRMCHSLSDCIKASEMSSLTDPRPVSGQLLNSSELQAKVRSTVLKLLSRRLSEPQKFPEGEDPSTNAVIMEYFKWIGYHHSADVLRKETHLSCFGVSNEGDHALQVLRCKLKNREENMPLMFTLIFQNIK